VIRGHEDLFVGIVSIGVGVSLLLAAGLNWEWFYELPFPRWLSRRLGRPVARLIHASMGGGLIALGIAVARGVRFWQPFGG
jgi:hypothetical protein